MKRFFTLGLVILAGLMFFSCDNGNADTSESKVSTSEHTAPLFSKTDIWDKETISLEDYKGKVVFLNFWATWCPPCRHEIPDLIKLQNNYSNELVVIGISLDRAGIHTVRNFAEEYNINYLLIMGDPKLVSDYGGVSAIPTSFIVDKNGELVERIVGYRTYEQFDAIIKKYLDSE
jgi:thiol-disulfide isomerase/thioredoxin